MIGGGIGGLTTAIALRRIGIEVTVYERAPELNDVGAGITLWSNATRVLQSLGLDALVASGRRFPSADLLLPSGRLLARSSPALAVERQLHAPTIVLHRAELQSALAAALPSGSLHFGMECSGIDVQEKRVAVTFANGASDIADLLVGADGIHSIVRRILFPDIQPRYSGYTAWRGIANGDAPTVFETWGSGTRFGIVPLQRERIYWFATQNTRAGAIVPPEERRERLLAIFGAWHPPIPQLIADTPPEKILHNDIYDIAPFRTWSRGRALLLGDAAHPTTPNMGQGACMAIESANVLATELAKGDAVEAAIARYESQRMPRTARITNESWRIGRVAQMENPLALALRNFVVRVAPASVTESHFLRTIVEG